MKNMVLCLALILAFSSYCAAEPPMNPAESAAMRFLEVLSKNDAEITKKFIRTQLAPDFLKIASLDQHMEQFDQMGRLLKDPEILDVRVKGTQATMTVVSRHTRKRYLLNIDVQAAEPHLIAGIQLEPRDAENQIPDAFTSLAEADNLFQALARKNVFSGTVLVQQKKQPVILKAYGLANREKEIPNDLDTSFNVGSITKAFTGVAILQLAQQGKLNLDDPLSKYLPQFPKATSDRISIRQLLRMESGYGDFFGRAFEERKDRLEKLDDYLDFIKDLPLEFEPGTDNRYSNAGYVILGGIIERVSGQNYFEYIRTHIYQPAGMARSGFFRRDALPDNVAVGYEEGSPNTPFLAPTGTSAGGSYSSARDMAAFYSALLENKLLDAENTILFLNHYDDSKKERPGVFGIAGGAPGISAVTLMNFETEAGIIVLTNSGSGIAEEAGMALRNLLQKQQGLLR